MTKEHTPGPWEWRNDADGVVRSSPGILLSFGVDGTPFGDNIDKANDRLIAAAPNLLDTLEKWAELIERTRETQSLFIKLEANSVADFMQALRETKQLISKAKGDAQ